jgi:hypothetical protein
VSFTGPVFWLLHALALAGALGVFFLVRCAVLAVLAACGGFGGKKKTRTMRKPLAQIR